jgi:putative cobalt transporter subunit CbtB
MSDVIVSSQALPEALHPPAISLRELAPWAVLGLALVALVYFVGVDAGATHLTGGNWLHEWVHDGRHLLGFPCH